MVDTNAGAEVGTGGAGKEEGAFVAGSLPVDLRNLSRRSETARSCDDKELCCWGLIFFPSWRRGISAGELALELAPEPKFGLIEHNGSLRTKNIYNTSNN